MSRSTPLQSPCVHRSLAVGHAKLNHGMWVAEQERADLAFDDNRPLFVVRFPDSVMGLKRKLRRTHNGCN